MQVDPLVEPADERRAIVGVLQVMRQLLDELARLLDQRGMVAATVPAMRAKTAATTTVTAAQRGSL